MSAKLSRRAFLGMATAAAASGALCAAFPGTALAVTSAEKRAEANAAREQLAAYQEQLNAASDAYYTALEEHEAAVAAMEEAQGRIDAAEAQITELQGHLAARAVEMYKNGNSRYMDVLLGASTFTDFASTWDFLNELNEEDAASVAQLKDAKAEAEAARDEYARQEQIAQQKLDEAEATKAEAENLVAQYDALVDSLDAEVLELVKEEEAAAQAAAAAAAQQAAAEEAAANNGAQADGGSSSDSSSSSGGGSSDSGSSSGGSSGGGASEPASTGGGGGGGGRGGAPDRSGCLGYAQSKAGHAYVWGATGPDVFDCSGLTQWSYRQIGVYIPRTSSAQNAGAPYRFSIGDAIPGDILWMSGHVGLYCGGGTSFEAMGDAYGICYGNAWRFSHAICY